jgi:hypothetical protein
LEVYKTDHNLSLSHVDLFITANELTEIGKEAFLKFRYTCNKRPFLFWLQPLPIYLLMITVILNSWKEETEVDRTVVEVVVALVLVP